MREEAAAAGVVMCERTAWKLCSQHGLWSSYGTKRSRNGKRPGPPVHDDLVAHVDAHRWRVMISLLLPAGPTRCGSLILPSIRPRKERLYFCAVKDIFSNRIIGYGAGSHMSSFLALSALNTAIARRKISGEDVAGCIVHCDRASQFRSATYCQALKGHGLRGSMDRVCWG